MSHTAQHEENHGTGEIKKVTIILSVLTIIELILGFWMIGITSEAIKTCYQGVNHYFNDGQSVLYRRLFHALEA